MADRRSELRETVFLLLFRLDFYGAEDLPAQIDLFFDGEDSFSEKEKAYVKDKTLKIAEKKAEIDGALEKVSVGWKPSRMPKVDLTILRLAYYEMAYDDSVPNAAAINEAVELAKGYGTENSRSFINGILAKVYKEISSDCQTVI